MCFMPALLWTRINSCSIWKSDIMWWQHSITRESTLDTAIDQVFLIDDDQWKQWLLCSLQWKKQWQHDLSDGFLFLLSVVFIVISMVFSHFFKSF
jgi:hypothetical protein